MISSENRFPLFRFMLERLKGLADGVVFDYVVPIFNMVTSTAKDSNGA